MFSMEGMFCGTVVVDGAVTVEIDGWALFQVILFFLPFSQLSS